MPLLSSSPQTSVPAPVPLHCAPIIPENWNADPRLRSVLLHQSSSSLLVTGSGVSGASAARLHLLLSLLKPDPAGTVAQRLKRNLRQEYHRCQLTCEAFVYEAEVLGRQVHQAAGGEINETGSFSSCHRSLKREGFRSVLLKEWEDALRAPSLSLHGQLSALADVNKQPCEDFGKRSRSHLSEAMV
ncbi:hypothetical protein IHE44_0003394 [Lamprotornis superbus]|uniref:Uncharacterized protein n=1 Tax=Lamprotornis superbus TaxID=245042 RepID=A0A835NSB4_9PASS|nr:hypothetical protein IHE44_0003394 [Lamprotornis superbus]